MTEELVLNGEGTNQELLDKLPLSGEVYEHEARQRIRLFPLTGSTLRQQEIEIILSTASHETYDHVRRVQGRQMVIDRPRSITLSMGHGVSYRSNVFGISGASYVPVGHESINGVEGAFIQLSDINSFDPELIQLPSQNDYRDIYQFRTTYIRNGRLRDIPDQYSPVGSYTLMQAIEKILITLEVFEKTKGKVLTPKVEAVGLISRDDLYEEQQLAFIVYSLPDYGLTWDMRFQSELLSVQDSLRKSVVKWERGRAFRTIYKPVPRMLGQTIRVLHDYCGKVHGQIVPGNMIFPVMVARKPRIMLTDWETTVSLDDEDGEMQRALEVHKAHRSVLSLYRLPGHRYSPDALKKAFNIYLYRVIQGYNGFRQRRDYIDETSQMIADWWNNILIFGDFHFQMGYMFLSVSISKISFISDMLINSRREISLDPKQDRQILQRYIRSRRSR